MKSSNNVLSVDDIQTMSMSDIVEAYGNGYRLNNLSNGISGLDISTWLGEENCIGTEPNQTCIKNGYVVAVGGIALLVLLTR